jgi:hypothetical protein
MVQRQHFLIGLQKTERELEQSSADFGDFSNVYADAARQLGGDRADGGTWAMPIVSLYRHAIELRIKAILHEFGAEAGICPECVLRRSHSLAQQLPDLRKVAKRVDVAISAEFERFIELWDKADISNMKSRYPRNKHGEPIHLENAEAFDLTALTAECESALDDLKALYDEHRFAAYQSTPEPFSN